MNKQISRYWNVSRKLFLFCRSHTLATPLRINCAVHSQSSLRRASVESPFAEDSQCFATLRSLYGHFKEAGMRLHCELFAVESQSKSPKCESGIFYMCFWLYLRKDFATIWKHRINQGVNDEPGPSYHPFSKFMSTLWHHFSSNLRYSYLLFLTGSKKS